MMQRPSRTVDRPRIGVLLGLFLLALSGCRQELSTQYGQRKGPLASSSVNGTAALGEMFEHQGHTVFSWGSLSPKLQQRADVIVWFPDDFQPPPANVCRWLDDWLQDSPGRTLIYVGRDFDAATWYWDSVLPLAPPSQTGEFNLRRSQSKTDFLAERLARTKSQSCPWFTVDTKARSREVQSLQGEPDWLEDVDPAKVAIELNGRILPPTAAKVLLRSDKDVLVSRQDRDESHLIVVANGSFLLNAMLVNRENRKLARQLVDEVGPPAKTVVFLESFSGGPPIRDDDSFPRVQTGMEIFHVWPTNWILLHLAILGVILCFARFPILGPPREPKEEDRADFGKHIQAMGELLERSGDTAYAQSRLLHYRQISSEVGSRKSEKIKKP